jgi:hypothetical protein
LREVTSLDECVLLDGISVQLPMSEIYGPVAFNKDVR